VLKVPLKPVTQIAVIQRYRKTLFRHEMVAQKM